MKKLYIIGNGFDLHHGLDTWYSSFGLYLQENESEIYDLLVKYIGMPELDSDDPETLSAQEWNEFEVSMANLFFEEIIEDHSEFAANVGSDDYFKDLNAIGIYVSEIRENLTNRLFDKFKDFILQIDYPKLQANSELSIDTMAHFFNFNYTSSLQNYYNVNVSKIKYIHGFAESADVLILGHGYSPESFEPKEPKPPENANDEELQEWHDWMSDQYDMSIDLGKSELQKYFSNAFKNSEKIIKENQGYFQSLSDIEEIIVFGHSLADVDAKYFQKIHASVKSNAKWFVTCRNESEMDNKRDKLVNIGINKGNVKPILVSSLLKINHLKKN